MAERESLPRLSALEMLDQAGLGREPDALRGAVERLAEEVERLRKIEEVFNDGWLPELPGEQAVLRTSALYHLRTLILEKTSV